MPAFSVIVPIYKVAAYLPKCADSILSQSFPDFELILVDDGSPDECGAICDKYALKDSRIRVIHKENGGLSSARNAGLDVACGKYICFVDGDDSILPDLLSTLLPYLENGADLVAFHYQNVYPDGRIIPNFYHETGSFLINGPLDRKQLILGKLIRCRLGWEAWTRVFVREKIEKLQLRFADNRQIFAEDLYFSLCYCSAVKKLVSIKDCLYNYLIREDSIMGVNMTRLNIGRMNELAKAALDFYLNHQNCADLIEVFPVIHLLTVKNAIDRAVSEQHLSYPEIRERAYQELEDPAFFRGQLNRLPRHKKLMKTLYSPREVEELVNLAKYLYDGSFLRYRIRGRLIRERYS